MNIRSEKYKEAIPLRYEKGLKIKDVAKEVGISYENARSFFSRYQTGFYKKD